MLITGESGAGNELIARAVHVYSTHRAKPFVAVNCGALAGMLLESELFGHVRVIFAGADRNEKGLIEVGLGGGQAHAGAVFLARQRMRKYGLG